MYQKDEKDKTQNFLICRKNSKFLNHFQTSKVITQKKFNSNINFKSDSVSKYELRRQLFWIVNKTTLLVLILN